MPQDQFPREIIEGGTEAVEHVTTQNADGLGWWLNYTSQDLVHPLVAIGLDLEPSLDPIMQVRLILDNRRIWPVVRVGSDFIPNSIDVLLGSFDPTTDNREVHA